MIDDSAPPPLQRRDYDRWAKDHWGLRMPQITKAELLDAHRVNVIDATPTMQGCAIRVGAMNGGSIDLHLNAAQAIHLFRNLALAGIDGGWMDEKGQPTTEPPVEDDLQRLPAPQEARNFLDQRG